MESINEKKSVETKKEKMVSKTWEAAIKSKGSVWVTYPKFVKLTQQCRGK